MPNLLIDAGPGCGKTHSLVDAYVYYRSSNKNLFLDRFPHTEEQSTIYKWCADNFPPEEKAIYMAYNTSIRDTMKKRIHKDCTASTIHGWGYSVLIGKHGHIPLIGNRGEILVENHTGRNFNQLPDKFKWLSTIRYLGHLKEELLEATEDNFYILQAKYPDLAAFPVHSAMVDQAHILLKAMKRVDRKIGIEYIDQIWNALFELKSPPKAIGFVDECQDLSPAKLEFASRFCANLLYVGDRNQAINAFSGADPYAFDRIRDHTANQLDLKLSFRLPPNLATRANNLKPTARIRVLPEKAPGIDAQVEWGAIVPFLTKVLEANPLIVCRYNAPLVKLAVVCLRNSIPCRALGDSLAKTLISTVKNRKASSVADLKIKLGNYEQQLLNNSRMKPMTKEALQDRFDCIRFILESCDTVADFDATIARMLKPHKDVNHVTASTIHKAKGLESKVVGILFPPVMSPRATTPEEILQEENCLFVALTRSARDLYEIVP